MGSKSRAKATSPAPAAALPPRNDLHASHFELLGGELVKELCGHSNSQYSAQRSAGEQRLTLQIFATRPRDQGQRQCCRGWRSTLRLLLLLAALASRNCSQPEATYGPRWSDAKRRRESQNATLRRRGGPAIHWRFRAIPQCMLSRGSQTAYGRLQSALSAYRTRYKPAQRSGGPRRDESELSHASGAKRAAYEPQEAIDRCISVKSYAPRAVEFGAELSITSRSLRLSAVPIRMLYK